MKLLPSLFPWAGTPGSPQNFAVKKYMIEMEFFIHLKKITAELSEEITQNFVFISLNTGQIWKLLAGIQRD